MPKNYVVESDPDDLDFFPRFYAALEKVRPRTGLRFTEGPVQDLAEDLVKYVNMEDRGRGAVNIIDDAEIMTRYVEIEGESEQFESQVADALVPLLPVVPLKQLQREAREKQDAKALKRMALGAGEAPDPTTVAIITEALGSGEEKRVAAGAEAAVILTWPDLTGAIEIARKDKHGKVTERLLEAALEACRPER